MKQRLFWKIWAGFWGTFLILSCGLWLFWTLQPTPNYGEWDAPRAVGRVLVKTAASALERGGRAGLDRQIAAWPLELRERLTVSDRAARCVPLHDREVTMPVSSNEGALCLRYRTPALPEEDTGLLAMPPDYLIASALAGLLFSAALAWYLTHPIRQLRRGFGALADGDFSVRLGALMRGRRDEIADLASDFDRMAEQLAELLAARDRLLHDVSHELRSPLARMRLAIGLLRRDPARFDASLLRIDREADHLDALVGELLTLARLESGVEQEKDYFDLVDVLKIVLEDLQFEAASHSVRIEADLLEGAGERPCVIGGSGLLIHRAADNILRNALRFSAAGQSIRVNLTRHASECVLVVEDEGPGIRATEPGALLKPFVRGGSEEGQGYGLGLAIAERSIKACGGTLVLKNRVPNGLSVTIVLPLVEMPI